MSEKPLENSLSLNAVFVAQRSGVLEGKQPHRLSLQSRNTVLLLSVTRFDSFDFFIFPKISIKDWEKSEFFF